MPKLELKKSMTVGELCAAFYNEFGAQIRVYNGRSRMESDVRLGDIGLANEGMFECQASITSGGFMERMIKEFGLKVKVYTCDYWVAVFDELTLEMAGRVKKCAVKADMVNMLMTGNGTYPTKHTVAKKTSSPIKNTIKDCNSGDNLGIVINRMYVGNYLDSNLGHEVINLFQADNGCNYVYLNSSGDFVKAHQGRVGYMLLVKYYGIGEIEVIGMAKDLSDVYNADYKFTDKFEGVNERIFAQQQKFAQDESGIEYGGVSIFDIFNDAEQQSVFITYKAKNIYVPKDGKKLFIRFHTEDESKCPEHDASDVVVKLGGYQQAKASLKQYIYPEGSFSGDLTRSDLNSKKEDYRRIRTMLIDDMSLWKLWENRVDEEELNAIKEREVSLFDVCKIQNDENKFSNALAYFMLCPEYNKMWNEFFGNIRFRSKPRLVLGDKYTITREEDSKIVDDKFDHNNYQSGGRIDLMVRTGDAMVVIENKIKSDINSISEDGNNGDQLNRYYNYANWLATKNESPDYGKERYFLILTPKYNIPSVKMEMKDVYEIITYKDLYEFLTAKLEEFRHDRNFVAFYEAMYRHTHENVNDYLYYEMQEKFIRRIIAESRKNK